MLALAVLGRADSDVLAAVTGAFDEAAVAARLPPDGDGWWVVDGESQAALLRELAADTEGFRQAHERAVRALASRLSEPDSALEAAFVAALGRLADLLLRVEPPALLALTTSIGFPSSGPPWARATLRFFEATGLAAVGRIREALAGFDELVAESGLDDGLRARTLNGRANCLRILGRHEAALEDYRRSRQLWETLGVRLRAGQAWLNTAIAAYGLHQHAEAQRCAERALAYFEEEGAAEWVAAAQNELALIHRDAGHMGAALEAFDAVAEQCRADGSGDRLAMAIGNKAEVLLLVGKLEEAAAAFDDAEAAMSSRVYEVDLHLGRGLVREVVGDTLGALDSYRAALATATEIGREEILPEVHLRMAEALRSIGDLEAARVELEAGVAVVERGRQPVSGEGLRIALLGRWHQVYEALVRLHVSFGDAAAAFHVAELARGRAFAEAIGGSAGSRSVSAAGDVMAALEDGEVLVSYFTTGFIGPDVPLLGALEHGSPVRTRLVPPASILAFVVTPAGINAIDCQLDPNALASASDAADARHRFLRPRVLARLRQSLLEPVPGVDAAVRVIAVPHGPLHDVPFGALAGTDGPDMVLAPSASVFVRHCRRREEAPRSVARCIAVGYDDPGGRGLRHSESEARFVAGITSGRAVAGGTSGQQVAAAAATADILHLACHGWFDRNSPLDSGLLVGPDEVVTAAQILGWHLDARLVVLSACATGVSRVLRGDEPMGLVRAFLVAGARTVLVSQWEVEDEATHLLMRRFYEVLIGDHCSAAAALRAAQRWLRSLTDTAGRTPYSDPCVWAAFVLVGEGS